jgi:groucho
MYITHEHTQIKTMDGHSDGASCIDIASDGRHVWSGGLDSTVRCWDWAEGKEVTRHDFNSQVLTQ